MRLQCMRLLSSMQPVIAVHGPPHSPHQPPSASLQKHWIPQSPISPSLQACKSNPPACPTLTSRFFFFSSAASAPRSLPHTSNDVQSCRTG